ncbi:MAG: hypothetical protein IPK17_23815 [Chloroflexi bacterium]|uniref:hypothetical protein n=1 Tax=Candidatus Flexifilum breve TaxID=3140694 RepID=UPI0031360C7D|nr:hypothetical protein [Chloroflexota bacterium]
MPDKNQKQRKKKPAAPAKQPGTQVEADNILGKLDKVVQKTEQDDPRTKKKKK